MILCGGAGTRLWPASRQTFPKHLLPVTGGQSLLQQTASRLSGGDFAPALVVGSEEQRFFIKRQLEEAGVAIEAILLEPVGRNTAAAAALAAAWLRLRGEDELMLVMPAASSCMFDFPRITAPASRSRRTTNASSRG